MSVVYFLYLYIYMWFKILTYVDAIFVLNKCKSHFADHDYVREDPWLYVWKWVWMDFTIAFTVQYKKVCFMCNVTSRPPGGTINKKNSGT